MDSNLPPDVHWLHRRSASDAAADAGAASTGPVEDAVEVAVLFCEALHDNRHYRKTLESLVVPESLPDWGGFTAAAGIVRSIPEPDYGILGTDRARGTVDVSVRSGTGMGVQAVVEMAWHDRIGAWLVAGLH
ncbi:hypothetical protein D477_010571 [Arthrobacter crystallopoietes BAB-32]|uniref:Uncharacterized protein n=1 Tax=Arthrobacter crystallopoietes BAB-32 TaxID=1246476 RepID=N1UZ20_9MICC|nr:hypothetical protein [Arthrobacter crystallopoietes]EMY34280.1 hypothetical protein D477_010571 [Arthrobacter crystallopoietes BAB-32]